VAQPLLRKIGAKRGSDHGESGKGASPPPTGPVTEHTDPPGCPGCEELLALERNARAAAEDASRAKDEFFLNLSHELRGPLSAIKNWVYLLRSGKLNEEDTAGALETLERNADAEARLITDMLDVSRIIAGQLRIELHPVDLAALVAESAATVRPAANGFDIRVDTEYETTDRILTADADRLRQVIENLLLNAIKFTPAGGRIVVRVGYDANSATIAVHDNGQGISSDLLPHVFERFRQGTFSSTHPGGLGLGLAIVEHIVDLHGGSVVAMSEGKALGATFTVTLPMDVLHHGDIPGTATPPARLLAPPRPGTLRVCGTHAGREGVAAPSAFGMSRRGA
jgi:signal transduction histidine kinase